MKTLFPLIWIVHHLMLLCLMGVKGFDQRLVGVWKVSYFSSNKGPYTYTITSDGKVSVKNKRTTSYLENSVNQYFPSSEGWYKLNKIHKETTWEYLRLTMDGRFIIRHFCTGDFACQNMYRQISNYCCYAEGKKVSKKTTPTYPTQKYQSQQARCNTSIGLAGRLAKKLRSMGNVDIFDERENILGIANDIMEYSPSNINAAERKNKSATSVLQSIDLFSKKLGNVICFDKTEMINSPNSSCRVGTIALKKKNVAVHISFVSKVDVRVNVGVENSLVSVDVSENATIEDGSSGFRGSIFIPISTLSLSRVLLYVNVYRTPVLFVDEKKITSDGDDDNTPTVNSYIIAVSIGEEKRVNLTQPIILTFKKISMAKGISKCVFWRFREGIGSEQFGSSEYGEWISFELIGETSDGIVTCKCYHLTNFAILLDVSQQGINNPELKAITYVGCALSIIGLLLTVIIHLSISNMRVRVTSKILVCLCISLMILLSVFLAGIEKTKHRLSCQIAAAIIHYFLLSTFTWMAVEAINMYRYFILVLQRGDDDRFFILASVLAWGAPAIIVICTCSIDPANLATGKYCFVHGLSFYIGVLSPVASLLLFNILILVVIMKVLSKNSIAGTGMDMLHRCRTAIILSILLGLTWVFAFFAIGRATYFFQLLFCIFNSLQGLFLFIAQTALNEDVKKALCEYYRRYKEKKKQKKSEKRRNNQLVLEENEYSLPNTKSSPCATTAEM